MQNNNNTQQPNNTAVPPIFPSSDDDIAPPITKKTDVVNPPPTNGSAAPAGDIIPPSVVIPEKSSSTPDLSTQTNKKFGGKKGKFIATILGILLLVGSIGAGVILVQQQQDVREKAYLEEDPYTPGGPPTSPPYIPPPPKDDDPPPPPASDECMTPDDCGTNSNGCLATGCIGSPRKCTYPLGTCTSEDDGGVDPGDVVDEGGGEGDACNIVTNPCAEGFVCHSLGGDASTDEICVDDAIVTSCEAQGRIWTENQWGRGMTCCLPGYEAWSGGDGCIKADTGGGETTPTTPPSITEAAQCVDVKAYDTDWNQLTSTQLSQLVAGDVIRFTVMGTSQTITGGLTKTTAGLGLFSKARFTINGTLRSEVTTLKPNTIEFYDEYTIPEGMFTFNITAQVFHDSLGWK